MGKQYFRDVHQAFHDVCHEFGGGDRNGGGIKVLAEKMSIAPGTLYNKTNLNNAGNNHHKPTLADVVMATELSGDTRIVEAFARASGGLFVRLPDMSALSTDALILHLAKIGDESGDFYRLLHDALSGDNAISKNEATALDLAAKEWIAAILEAVMRIREMGGLTKG